MDRRVCLFYGLLFSGLTGEENDLLGLGFLLQDVHGGPQAGVVEAYQCVIQHQRGVGNKRVSHRKTKRQIQLFP